MPSSNYEEVTYPQDLATTAGEIALCKLDLERSKDRLDWSTRMAKKGFVTEATKIADELSLEMAQFDVEQAETQRDILMKYTQGKTLQRLQAAVEMARAGEAAKRSAWEVEKAKEDAPGRPISPESN